MNITSGLFDHMVLQRTARGVSDQLIQGVCRSSGPVTVTTHRLRKRVIGHAARGRFRARLRGLPVGGPYDLTLRVGDEQCVVRDVLVGDVWLLGGQSNMQGCGQYLGRARPHPQVRAHTMSDRWKVAQDPIHDMWNALDEIHHQLAGGRAAPPSPVASQRKGVGPGVAFGRAMFDATGVPQGLIASAHGGTSMAQWDPDHKGSSLYNAMTRRLRRDGGRVAGLVWYQGESDAINGAAARYTDAMKKFVRRLRRDARDPRLPAVIVQLGRYVAANDHGRAWNFVQDQQRLLPRAVKHLATVPAIDLPLDDAIHLGSDGQHRLGRRLAQAMLALRGDRRHGRKPIELRQARVVHSPRDMQMDVVLEFDHVVGALTAGGGRPMGFAFDHPTMPAPFDTRLKGDKVILHCAATPAVMDETILHYGRGLDPACNIVDEADRSLPVLMQRLGRLRALTPHARAARVSDLLPAGDTLTSVTYPPPARRKNWHTFRGQWDFLDLHERIGKTAPENRVVYFALTVHCPENMRLSACVGYDGPVKVWIDGRLRFTDPRGVNPAWPDKAVIPMRGTKGRHEVVVGLHTNGGRAWGVFIRFERTGVRPADIQAGKVRLPTLGL